MDKDAGDYCPASELTLKIECLACQVEYLLNTGNLVSNSTLDLSQNTGFTVVAEKLNFFRCASHHDETCEEKHPQLSQPKFIMAAM